VIQVIQGNLRKVQKTEAKKTSWPNTLAHPARLDRQLSGRFHPLSMRPPIATVRGWRKAHVVGARNLLGEDFSRRNGSPASGGVEWGRVEGHFQSFELKRRRIERCAHEGHRHEAWGPLIVVAGEWP
jgi:hypothetical protein